MIRLLIPLILLCYCILSIFGQQPRFSDAQAAAGWVMSNQQAQAQAAAQAQSHAQTAAIAAHNQQLADITRRMEQVDRMNIGDRLARIEMKLEESGKQADKMAGVLYGVLSGVTGLLLEAVIRLAKLAAGVARKNRANA